MKRTTLIIAVLACLVAVSSCGAGKYMQNSTPEESGLNLTKITDENNTSVCGHFDVSQAKLTDLTKSARGCAKDGRAYYIWDITNSIAISPDGTKIAHLSKKNDQINIVVRSINGSASETQRTFRNVTDVCWGTDNKLYFSDNRSTYQSYAYNICSINAEQGNLMNQLTNGSVRDFSPATIDGKNIYFTRMESNGPAIWRYSIDGGALTFCSRGFYPCLIKDNPSAFYCVRNSSEGRSEIWLVDFEKGTETCVLSDETRGFTQPSISPDGQWLLCVGNSVSSVNKTRNLDIYVVKTDGTQLTQLTTHPDSDVSPVWSKDGKQIFFVSTRANKKKAANIWRMNFQPY